MLQLHVSSAHWLYITVSYTRLLLPCTNMYECNDELFLKLMAYGTIGVGGVEQPLVHSEQLSGLIFWLESFLCALQ